MISHEGVSEPLKARTKSLGKGSTVNWQHLLTIKYMYLSSPHQDMVVLYIKECTEYSFGFDSIHVKNPLS
jgi:hypothetical protein